MLSVSKTFIDNRTVQKIGSSERGLAQNHVEHSDKRLEKKRKEGGKKSNYQAAKRLLFVPFKSLKKKKKPLEGVNPDGSHFLMICWLACALSGMYFLFCFPV